MTRHSKNNTNAPIFTYAERARVDYGVKERRAGKDSFRESDACHLCLRKAIDPVLCSATHGHLYCRTCLVDSMLAQMEANKVKQAEYAAWLQQAKLQEGRTAAAEEAGKIAKFMAEVNAKEADIEPDRKKSKSTAAVASHWIPTEALKHEHKEVPKAPDNKIYCSQGSQKHTVLLKRMTAVAFTTLAGTEKSGCPSCLKALHNGMELVALLPCGHIFCSKCIPSGKNKDVTPQRCTVCEEEVLDVASLAKEGTGFAGAGGQVLVSRYDLAFHC